MSSFSGQATAHRLSSPEPAAEVLGSEVEVLYSISSILAHSGHAETCLASVVPALRQLPGIQGAQFLWAVPTSLHAGFWQGDEAVRAIAPVRAGERVFGEVRIFFSLQELGPTSPARLAAFVGQQVGLWLSQKLLTGENDQLRRQLREDTEKLAHVKVVARAVGLLVARHHVSAKLAQTMLHSAAERSGRTVLQLAQAVIETDRPGLVLTGAPLGRTA